MAHSDITFFWDTKTDTLKIPTSSPPTLTKGGSYVSSGGPDDDGYYDNDGTSNHVAVTVTSEDIISLKKGSLGLWFNLQYIANYDSILGFGDNTDLLEIYLYNSKLNGNYKTAGNNNYLSGVTTLSTGDWHYLYIQWADGNNGGFVRVYMDGILEVEDTSVSGSVSYTSGTLYFCDDRNGGGNLDAFICKPTITSNPNTPQLWTANGKPLILPDFKSEVA